MIWSLEIAKRSLQAQMMALDVTSHNIANANTDGYSRQDAVFSPTQPYGIVSWLGSTYPGQVGTGVQISGIRRLHNDFVDMNYRNINSENSYYSTKDQIYGILESSINELQDSGLSKAFTQFFDAWQEGSVSPEDPTVRRNIVQESQSLIDSFRYVQNQLISTRSDTDSQVVSVVGQINDIGKEIAKLNDQISLAKNQGEQPNDLLDQRDSLLDQLSQYINIQKVDLPTGSVSVYVNGLSFVDDRVVNEIKAIDNDQVQDDGSGNYSYNSGSGIYNVLPGTVVDGKWNGNIALGTSDLYNGHVSTLWVSMGNNTLVPLDNRHLTSGKLKALVDMRDDVLAYGNDPGKGLLSKTNQLAYYFFSKVNTALQQGKDLNGNPYASDFFNLDGASPYDVLSKVSLDQNVVNDPTLLPLGTSGESGDGSLASIVAQQQNEGLDNQLQIGGNVVWPPTGLDLPLFLKGQSASKGWSTIISEWASDISRNKTFLTSSDSAKNNVTLFRSSESGVNLDEEAVNLIRFQKGYAMAARIVTTVDSMLDTIINMGSR
jgi:flagellar hook-associated protein 1 FlgK